MRISMAHVNIQGLSCAIFGADSPSRTDAGRRAALARLTNAAVRQGLHVDKAALQYENFGCVEFFGHQDLTRYLANNGGVSRWTHELEV